MKGIKLDRKMILDRIPHGGCALLIDNAILYPKSSVDAVYSCTGTEQYFIDHYPGDPILPGCILIEVFGQAAAILCSSIDNINACKGYLTGVERMRIKKRTVPPAILSINIVIKHLRFNNIWFECKALNNKEIIVAQAILSVAFDV